MSGPSWNWPPSESYLAGQVNPRGLREHVQEKVTPVDLGEATIWQNVAFIFCPAARAAHQEG